MPKTPAPPPARYFEVLPPKPMFLKMALWVGGLNIVLMALSPAISESAADLDKGFVISLALFALFFLLLMGVSRGSGLARKAYLGLDIGMTGLSLALGTSSTHAPGATAALSTLLVVLSLATWTGLLHPLSGAWVARVQAQRKSYPLAAQLARATFELKMALPWFLFAMVMLKTAPLDEQSQVLALAVNLPLVAIAAGIGIYQGLRILALKRTKP